MVGSPPTSSGRDPDGTGGPHLIVDDLDNPIVTPADRHHLERVRRVRSGDPITFGDGSGRWRPARFGADLEPTGDIVTVPAPSPRLTVGFALVKGERPEWVTQKLTELGIDVIVPFTAGRSVVRWEGPRADANHERLTRVAREAAMQCRRAWLPTVEPLTTFGALAETPGVALAQQGGPPLGADTAAVLIGPEGGWTDEERTGVTATVGLGVHVLRAETAAIAAGTLLAARRSGL
jgi:16S rRNA (uracil1498-N3)-methyltransferase